MKLFKSAGIANFSSSEIGGYKNKTTILNASNWFFGQKTGTESSIFFSFTDDEHIDSLFRLIEAFNKDLETNSPIRAVVVPVERCI